MEKPIFSVTIENFHLVPYQRMTARTKQFGRAKRYLESRMALEWHLKAAILKRTEFPIRRPVILSFSVHYRDRRTRDLDNVQKAISDALQAAGIIQDDKLIVGTKTTRVWNDGKNRVVISLYNATL